MTLVKWRPRSINMVNEFDNIFNSLFHSDFRNVINTTNTNDWEPNMDLKESDKNFLIEADIAGLEKKDISINLNGDHLTISGNREEIVGKKDYYHFRERSVGAFTRTFNLPKSINRDKISANFKNGILSIKLEKHKELIPKAKEITIN